MTLFELHYGSYKSSAYLGFILKFHISLICFSFYLFASILFAKLHASAIMILFIESNILYAWMHAQVGGIFLSSHFLDLFWFVFFCFNSIC